MQTELKYSQRDAKDCLDYLLENKKLIWVGADRKGHLEAPQPIEEGFDNPEEHENGLFS